MGKNVNDIDLDITMKRNDYRQAKIDRLDILIENATNQPLIDLYNGYRLKFLADLPKNALKKHKSKKMKTLEITEEAIAETVIETPTADTVIEDLKKQTLLSSLTLKRERLLKELEDIDNIATKTDPNEKLTDDEGSS